MPVVVSSQGDDLDAPVSPVFGRCPVYLFVDTETMEWEAVANPAMNQSGGAGVQAAQFVVNRGAQAVLTGNLGPNAFEVLQAAGIPGYLISEGTIRQAVEAFREGCLPHLSGASVGDHAEMGGRGIVVGQRAGGRVDPLLRPSVKEAELASLRERLKSLRQELAEVMTRIEQLEKEREG